MDWDTAEAPSHMQIETRKNFFIEVIMVMFDLIGRYELRKFLNMRRNLFDLR